MQIYIHNKQSLYKSWKRVMHMNINETFTEQECQYSERLNPEM